MKKQAFSVGLLVAGMTLIGGMALAQTPAEMAEAKQLYQAGVVHYDAGRYAVAEKSFARAYELSKRPGFLWNMAECARLGGNSDHAVDLYRRYLKENPQGEERAEAEKWIAKLDKSAKPAAPVVRPERKTEPGPRATQRVNVLSPGPETKKDSGGGPIYNQWWFWAGTGVVVTGVIAVAVLSSGGSDNGGSVAPAPSGPGVTW